MLYPTHLLLGIIFYLFSHEYLAGGNVIIFFLILMVTCLFPDIDEEHSVINRATGPFGTVIAFFTKHRGFFHSIFLYLGLFVAVSIIWSNYYGWAILLGYLAHLLGDGMTPMGVKIFHPFHNFKIRGPIRAGSTVEGILLIILIIIVIKIVWF